jgi:hypothetical protein
MGEGEIEKNMEQNNTMSLEQAAEQIRKVLAPMPENRQFFITAELEEALRVAVDCIEKVQRIPTEEEIARIVTLSTAQWRSSCTMTR